MPLAYGPAAEARTPVSCAGATVTTTTPSGSSTSTTVQPGSQPAGNGSCWEDVAPYPFGSSGEPVDAGTVPECGQPLGEVGTCALTVTSLAFRAWNRGLAATTSQGGPASAPGVWIYNGTYWYPSPTFPGAKKCPGNTIVWAGKLDYWLVGPGEGGEEGKWANLCRFEGKNDLEWEQFQLPSAAREHIGRRPGGITSAACYAWNDCWFFGTYGTALHWNGKTLADASEGPVQSLLQGEFTAAATHVGPAGEQFGAAVSATAERSSNGPLTTQRGAPPAQLFGSSGGAFAPLPFVATTSEQPADPYRTDLVAVGLDASGQGWVAGNPAGLRLEEARNGPSVEGGLVQAPFDRPFSPPTPQPSPLIPVSTLGASPTCPGPPPTRLTYTPEYHRITSAGAQLWSSIAVLPSDEALAGGKMWGATEGAQPPAGEPVIARANCEGATTLTRFTEGSSGPSDPAGDITALAAGTANEAWAASSEGRIGEATDSTLELPHFYRLTNGEPPEGPEENEEEPQRHHEEEEGVEEEPPVVFEPPPALPPVEATPQVTRTRTTLPPPIYDVKTRLRTTRRQAQVYLRLYITFNVRRPVTIGAKALRDGRVVSEARPRRFAGHSGQLILSLNRKHWPTKVAFIS
jgi:hypothetical protein